MDTRAVHLPDELFAEVRAIAKANDRSVPGQLRVIVREWIMVVDKQKAAMLLTESE